MPQDELMRVPCPCCGSTESSAWVEEVGYQVERCASCALLFVNPRPAQDYIDAAVRSGLHNLGGREITVRSRRIPSKIASYRKRVKALFADVIAADRPVRWIDVGAGYGEFLEAAQQVLPRGSEVIGVEPMNYKAMAACARGLNVIEGYLQPGQFQADVISNIDVFSHIPDYHSFLATVVSNLRPGGEVMIETGNLADLKLRREAPNELGLPDHLVFAGRASMERYLSRARLKIVKINDERFDTISQISKNIVKIILGRRSYICLPYTSKYRQSIFRARLEV